MKNLIYKSVAMTFAAIALLLFATNSTFAQRPDNKGNQESDFQTTANNRAVFDDM